MSKKQNISPEDPRIETIATDLGRVVDEDSIEFYGEYNEEGDLIDVKTITAKNTYAADACDREGRTVLIEIDCNIDIEARKTTIKGRATSKNFGTLASAKREFEFDLEYLENIGSNAADDIYDMGSELEYAL